jgi:MoaA/NifB/PqqE/SkfB family radical SAM enzyme
MNNQALLTIDGKYPENTKNVNWETSTTGKHSMEAMMQYAQELDTINLETHSACNYSKIHCNQCPVATRTEMFGKHKLSMDVIQSIFEDLNTLGYRGTSFFHSYNEALMDKRIYDIIKMHHKICLSAKTGILTNGRLLTEEVGHKLMDAGVTTLEVSAYHLQDPEEVGNDEYHRIVKVMESLKEQYPNNRFSIGTMILDDRMNFYDHGWAMTQGSTRPENGLQPCPRAVEQLIIASCGHLQLCCYEWKKENKFGNLNEKRLIDILETSNFLNVRQDLKIGHRDKYYPCDRCY